MVRRTTPPRPPAGPPDTTAAAAAFVRSYVVKLYDRQDGHGVNWQVIAETLFKAAFDVVSLLPLDQRRGFTGRVHEWAYDCAADPPPAAPVAPAGPDFAPPDTVRGDFKKPDHGLG